MNNRPHATTLETTPDNALLLRSNYPLGPVARCTGDWLHHWAAQTPDALFIAERDGSGWRALTYAQTLQQIRNLAAWLLATLGPNAAPIAILSGNSVNHALLSLAAQYIGLATAPLAEQYSLIPGAHDRLTHLIDILKPSLIYTEDAARYADALALPALANIPVLATNPSKTATPFSLALRGAETDIDAANQKITPATVAKILFTSGSTSHPKGVPTTHGMLCTNQTQIADAFPFLRTSPPRILDWLPWNHVFGGSHNFNMMLANGGALYVDDGKPTDDLFPRSLENLNLITGTLSFNVPIGYARLLPALRADPSLRQRFFENLNFAFYAGASLPQDIWDGLIDMAHQVTGRDLMMISSWGMTETAPCGIIVHEPVARAGILGVPVPGVTAKLIPQSEGRYELRFKGPNVMTGYYNDPAKTAQAFDGDGYLITQDAVRFVDPTNPDKGLSFDGRITEDFKLLSGTWARVASLRATLLTALGGLATDAIITGHSRADLGALIVPATPPKTTDNGAATDPAMLADLRQRLATLANTSTGNSTRIARALVLATPPALAAHEVTAKGNINTAKLLANRAALVDRLYGDPPDAAVIIL